MSGLCGISWRYATFETEINQHDHLPVDYCSKHFHAFICVSVLRIELFLNAMHAWTSSFHCAHIQTHCRQQTERKNSQPQYQNDLFLFYRVRSSLNILDCCTLLKESDYCLRDSDTMNGIAKFFYYVSLYFFYLRSRKPYCGQMISFCSSFICFG